MVTARTPGHPRPSLDQSANYCHHTNYHHHHRRSQKSLSDQHQKIVRPTFTHWGCTRNSHRPCSLSWRNGASVLENISTTPDANLAAQNRCFTGHSIPFWGSGTHEVELPLEWQVNSSQLNQKQQHIHSVSWKMVQSRVSVDKRTRWKMCLHGKNSTSDNLTLFLISYNICIESTFGVML